MRAPPPGEGVICALGIYTAMAEVGGRCFPGEDDDVQAELRRSVARLDAYVLKSSKMTQADLDRFKRTQGLVGSPTATLCKAGDAVTMYRMLRTQGPGPLRSNIDKAVERDGPPTWGTCL